MNQTLITIIKETIILRKLQKEYAKNRSNFALNNVVTQEKLVDKMLEEIQKTENWKTLTRED